MAQLAEHITEPEHYLIQARPLVHSPPALFHSDDLELYYFTGGGGQMK